MTDQKNLQALKDESIAEIKNMLHEMEHLYENVKGETQEHTKEAKAKLKDRIAQARRKVEAYEVDAKQKASAALHKTSAYAKENPKATTGIVAAATVLLGVLAYKSVRK